MTLSARRRMMLAAGLVAVLGAGAGAYFVTLPPAVVTLGAAGDIACGPDKPEFTDGSPLTCQQMATSDLLVKATLGETPIAAVLPLGDNQYDAGMEGFKRSYGPSWGRLDSIAYPVPGNHEYLVDKAKSYWDYFGAKAGERGKGWYSFNLGRWHLIALNGTCDEIDCSTGSEQVAWLRKDLAAHHNKCTLAYWHYPLFSGGEGGGDLRVKPLVQALYDANADVILTGHNHAYERFGPMTPDGTPDAARGIPQFVVGTGGRSHYPTKPVKGTVAVDDKTFGVIMMTLRPDSYDWKFVPTTTGGFTDSGTGKCH